MIMGGYLVGGKETLWSGQHIVVKENACGERECLMYIYFNCEVKGNT